MLYREQAFASRALHSELQQQTNTVNTQKSPPWACGKRCAEACAERFSALKIPAGNAEYGVSESPIFKHFPGGACPRTPNILRPFGADSPLVSPVTWYFMVSYKSNSGSRQNGWLYRVWMKQKSEQQRNYRMSQKFVPLISCHITFDQNFIFTWNFWKMFIALSSTCIQKFSNWQAPSGFF